MAAASFVAQSQPFIEVAGGSGTCGQYCNDTWTLALNTPVGPSWYNSGLAGPDGRKGASLAWDAAEGELVLFGGLNGTYGALNQTWYRIPYVTAWEPLPGPTLPPARYDASFTYDPALGGLVLFGGVGAGGQVLSDTWVFRHGAWSPLNVANPPPARSGATLAYQATEDRMVLFGGNGSAGPLSDTWALTGSTWVELHPTSSPPPRTDGTGEADAQGDPIVFGGWGPGGYLNDTWVLLGDNWTQPATTPGGAPPPLEGASMVGDPGATANDFLVLWGSNSSGVDIWLWSLRVWNGGVPPPPRSLELGVDLGASTGSAPLLLSYDAYGEEGTPPYGYNWNFGDGTPVSASPSGAHLYAGPGEYIATAKVRDSGLPPQAAQRSVDIWVRTNSTFAVNFTSTPPNGTFPLSVSFVASVFGGVPPFVFQWSFGDGTANATTTDANHIYQSPGTFLATLRVRDSTGAVSTWSRTLQVFGQGLTVGLSASPPQGTVPLHVTFLATPVNAFPPLEYFWDFGDGNRSYGASPSVAHWYNTSGAYTVRVTVVGSSGANATGSFLLQVGPRPRQVLPPPSALDRLAHALGDVLVLLEEPAVWGLLAAAIITGGAYRWARVSLPLYRRVRRALPRRPLRTRWALAEAQVVVRELRRGTSLPLLWRKLRPLLLRDLRRAAERLRWHPGQDAVWLARRVLLLVPQLLLASTVLFLGIRVLPAWTAHSSRFPALPPGPLGFLHAWWSYVSGLFSTGLTDPYLAANLPYTLQFVGVIVLLSLALSYPLGLLAGWYRGRVIDHSTRSVGIVANAVPVLVVAFVTLTLGWLWYYQLSNGDTLLGSLPSGVWEQVNLGGAPTWIATDQATSPTGFVLVDAPLHGAWAIEQVVLLKLLIQALPVALVYSSIFLRYARLATEETSYAQSNTGGRARGLSDRQLLWKHAGRRVLPVYAEVLGATFPTLLSLIVIAEWAYGDLGLGSLFLSSLTFLSPLTEYPQSNQELQAALRSSATISRVAFVLLLMVFIANLLGDGISRALDPVGRAERQ